MSLTPRIDTVEQSVRNLNSNLIINGNLDIWQRTTSIAVTFNQTRAAADRFVLDSWGGASANVTMARVAEVPTLGESGFNSLYSLKLTNNNASGSAVTLRYTLEGHDYQAIHTSKVRFQFWVRSSLTGTYSVAFNNDRGLNNRYYLTTYNIDAANVWQKVAIDVELDNTANWAFDNTAGLSIMFGIGIPTTVSVGKSILNSWQTGDGRTYLSNNAWATTLNATWQIAQIRLTKGDFADTVDLPFARHGKNIQEEISMCQRYFQTVTAEGNTSAAIAQMFATGATQAITRFQHFMPMRIAPTFSSSGTATDYRLDGSNLVTASAAPVLNNGTTNSSTLTIQTAGSLVANAGYLLVANTGSNARLNFEAEIGL